MDDNRIMEAAKLIANSSAALIQAIGMMSENIERANRGESLAYTEDQFMKLIQDNGITQLWFIPLIERIQNACCRHYDDVDMLWENFVKKMTE